MRTVDRADFPGGWIPLVHSDCPHNEVAALLKRSLAPLPDTVFKQLGPDVLRIFTKIRHLAARSGVTRMSLLQTAESYSGRLRDRYIKAERSLREDGPVGEQDWFLRPFLKAEKVNAAAKFPKPRMIFPRSPRYNLALASRLKPLEHWMWGRLTSRVVLGCGEGRVVAKGLNPRQRANLIVRKFRALDDAIALEVDGKAFEAHVGEWQLKEEHGVYEAAFPGDEELSFLLRAQLELKGKLRCGAKFSRKGGRASGDYNTGMGNSLIMLAVVGSVLKKLAPGKFDLLIDGDNAVVFLERSVSDRVLSDFASCVLNSSGHEIELGDRVDYIEGIVFGQSNPINLGGHYGWTMVRDPRKVISQALSSHRWLREPTFAREWIRGVAACELSIARGVPVLQAWSLGLQARWGGPEGVRAHPHVDYFYQGAWLAGVDVVIPVSLEARQSFEKAFGLAPDEQLRWERSFKGPRQSLTEWDDVSPLSFDRWLLPPGFIEPWDDLHAE